MSLINQMLQDLDSRRAADGPKSGLPNEVRPLPVARRSSALLIVGVGVVVTALVGWFVWQQGGLRISTERRTEVPVAGSVQVAAAVVAHGLPPSPVVATPAVAAEIVVPSPVPPWPSAEDEAARLRLTTSLQLMPERKPSPAPRAAPAISPKPVAMASTGIPPALPSTISPLKPSGPMVIEKSTAAGSSHERAEGEYRKAMSVLNMGRLPDAIENLRAALKQDAAHTASRQLLFKLLVENRYFDEAAELLQEGLRTQPSQIVWAMSLGRLQVDRGDLPGAWQTLQRSLPSAAGSADYQGFAAHVLQRLGRNREAAEFYQLATRLAPSEGRWWLGLGLVLEADGRATEARDAMLRAKASGTLGGELSALVEQKLRQLP